MTEPAGAGQPGAAEPPEVVLVLGCPTRPDGWPSAMQRWRVDLAAAVAGPATTWLFSGFKGEADTMAADARRRHDVPPGRIVREPLASTTWENVARAAPLVPPGARVVIVSDPWHAARAAGYWRTQFPERADEVSAAGALDWRHPILGAAATSYEVVLRLLRRHPVVSRR